MVYVEGSLFNDYIEDMKLTQKFAVLNRKAMADVIISNMGFTVKDEFTTIHNYIDTDYMKEMKGIYTTCVSPETLDESPMAYKRIDEIIELIEPTAEIIKHIKPVYNFKAAD